MRLIEFSSTRFTNHSASEYNWRLQMHTMARPGIDHLDINIPKEDK